MHRRFGRMDLTISLGYIFNAVLFLNGFVDYIVSAEDGCERMGTIYRPGTVLKDNCNECTCIADPVSVGHIFKCTDTVCLVQERIIYVVNYGNYGWQAGNYSQFWGMSLVDGITNKLGSLPSGMAVVKMTPVFIEKNVAIPANFDARSKWPNYIHSARNQGNCGASWAFSSTDVAADRLAIETKGAMTENLSVQHLISCNKRGGQNGCNGGYVDVAFQFIRRNGLLTEDCYEYTSGKTKSPGVCLSDERKKSSDCSEDVFSTLKTSPPYRISTDEKEIMTDIMKKGPVQATMIVKEDFFMYKSGIYRYSKIQPDNIPHGSNKAFQSVRIIGWGEERIGTGELVKYWICANSWGPDWGEEGFFRIQRGNPDSKLEAFVVAVHISKLEVAPSDKTVRKIRVIRDATPPGTTFSFRRHFFNIYTNYLIKLRRRRRARLKIAVMKTRRL